MAIININANLNGGDDTTPDNELFYRIYGDIDAYASPIHTTGTAIADANVTVAGDVVDISNVDGTTNTSFKIAAVDGAGNEGILSDAVAYSSYILDSVPGSVGAWSLRQLKSSITNVVRVRRSNDDAELDFTPAQITDGTLTTWTGANDGFVTTLYDQSDTGTNDMTMGVDVTQPKLVSSGSVLLINSLPSISFEADFVRLTASSNVLTTGLFSINAVLDNQAVGTGVNEVFLANNDGTATEGRTVYIQCQDGIDLKNVLFFNNGASQIGAYSTDWTNGQHMVSVYGDNSNYSIKRDNGAFEQVITGAALTQMSLGMSIGNYNAATSTNAWSGSFQEIVIWASDESANRTEIESNQNAYYSVY